MLVDLENSKKSSETLTQKLSFEKRQLLLKIEELEESLSDRDKQIKNLASKIENQPKQSKLPDPRTSIDELLKPIFVKLPAEEMKIELTAFEKDKSEPKEEP